MSPTVFRLGCPAVCSTADRAVTELDLFRRVFGGTVEARRGNTAAVDDVRRGASHTLFELCAPLPRFVSFNVVADGVFPLCSLGAVGAKVHAEEFEC